MIFDYENGYRIRGYCERFLHTLIKFSFNDTPKTYDFTPSPPLTMEDRINQYLRTIFATQIDYVFYIHYCKNV